MIHKLLVAGAVVVCCHSQVGAQQYATVQLPTFQQFSIGTSVLVPDQGSTYLGGVGRSAQGSSRYGSPFLPGSRSSGGSTSASGVSVSAFIHDFEEMDAAVLEQARRMRGGPVGEPRYVRARRNIPRATNSTNNLVNRMSRVSDLRQRTQDSKRKDAVRAEADFQTAQRLLAKGKLAAARTMLLNSQRRAGSGLQKKIAEQLAELDRVPAGTRVAAR